MPPAGDAVEAFLRHIEEGATHRAVDLALQRLEQSGVPDVIHGLLAPVQRAAGDRWHLGRYTVTQEHIVSGVVDDILGLVSVRIPTPDIDANRLALVCAEGEWHGTPARMAALLIRDAGWRVQFLGASTPPDHLRTSLPDLGPQALGISCTLPLALAGVPGLTAIAGELGVPTILGGRAVGSNARYAARLGAHGAFADTRSAIRALEGWLDTPPPAARPPADDELDQQRAVLTARRHDIVERTFASLDRQLPMMASFDERRRRHTWQDLEYLLSFADIALLVDDGALFSGFTTWLSELLVARGLPPTVMPRSLAILRQEIGRDLPALDQLLADADRSLRQTPAEAIG